MKSRSITYTKNHFSAVVREVQQGESYLVCDYGKPVARICPAADAAKEGEAAGMIAALERNGLVRRGSGSLDAAFFSAPLPRPGRGGSVVAALLREREESR